MPSINLVKGEKTLLVKEDGSTITQMTVGLGWDENSSDANTADLDASLFAVTSSGKVLSESHFVYFGNLKTPNKSILHMGDDLTGGGNGDCEQIKIDLTKIEESITEIHVAVNIYEAEKKNQNFGQVRNAFIRICDDKGQETVRYDLTEDYSTETALIFGRIYRHNSGWKFDAVGTGKNTYSSLVEGFGLTV
jgi:tellurium resistance protein TerD